MTMVGVGREFDSEIVAVEAAELGKPVDGPDDPRTVYGTIVARRDHDRTAIVPAWLRNPEQRREITRWAVGYSWYAVRFHAARSWLYAARTGAYATVGAVRATGSLVRWVLDRDSHPTALDAARPTSTVEYLTLAKVRAERIKQRLAIASGSAVATAASAGVAWAYAPGWVLAAGLLVPVGVLARAGRPVDKPIVDRVVNGPRFVKLTAEQVRAALTTLGITGLKAQSDVSFPQEIHRDGPGWLARVNLPAGVEATDVVERRGRLSSALRLPVDQVWPSAGPDHAGQVDLWVGYQPASKMKQPKWELAAATARTSVFEPVAFATDQRVRPVKTTLFARNFLIGGVPGSGKSFGARTLALAAALDPTVELKIAEFKGTADFGDLAHLCSTYVCGVDDQSLAEGADIISWGLVEAERRGRRIRKAKERGLAPEGKVTPELAATPDSGLHPLFILIDEAHELLCNKEAADDAERLIKRGRALGIIVALATQIPDRTSLPPNITRCVTVRWCMAVQDQVANDMILGTGAYKRGLSAAVYRPGVDAGWGIFSGDGTPGPARSFYPTPEESAAIIARATQLRGGQVVGGGDSGPEVMRRDILADVATLILTSERGAHWDTLADRLTQLDPIYTAINGEAVSARLRALGIPSVDIKNGGITRKGCRRDAIIETLTTRLLAGSGTETGSGTATPDATT